jgi:DNA-binding beta-propeller fold protein YncE
VTTSQSEGAIVSSGEFRFRAISAWARWPGDWQIREVAAVATDSQDRVFVFSRGDHPVAVFDRDGELLFSWGEGLFNRPHGITIGPGDAVYCADDLDHTVRKFTAEGKLLWTLGTSGRPSDTGATSLDYRTIRRAAGPFHYPTNLTVAASGEIFVSDGYGNARIHKFSADGKLLLSWGEPGDGPGQFHVPHGLAVDRQGTVYVADRENSRLQLFSPDGEYMAEWTDVARPCELAIDAIGRVYVAELGELAGRWPGWGPPPEGATGGRVSIFDSAGTLLARFGGGLNPTATGDFFAPHDIWLDSRGDFYVAEVVRSASGNQRSAGNQRPAAGDYHTLQKFTRL